MPELMRREQFEPLVGKSFHLKASPEQTVLVELFEVQALKAYARKGGKMPEREPFALYFRGPMEFILPQRIYALAEDTLGEVEIFLVPIGPDAAGQRYEAIFN